MKTYEELEKQRLRSEMRAQAMEYRKAISPGFLLDMNARLRFGISALRLAKFYRRMARGS